MTETPGRGAGHQRGRGGGRAVSDKQPALQDDKSQKESGDDAGGVP